VRVFLQLSPLVAAKCVLVLSLVLASTFAAAGEAPAAGQGFTLWQLPAQGPAQMQSYVLRTAGGKLVVVDGGRREDAPYLKGFVAALGNEVEAWFVSHPHTDHLDALNAILAQADAPLVCVIYASLLPPELLDDDSREEAALLQRRAGERGIPLVEPEPGQRLDIDGMRIEILGVKNPEITVNPVNNSSMVWRVEDATKSVLFTGDIGEQAGRKLLDGPYRDKLAVLYVQMAHHGQAGADEAFYQAVRPVYALWPTPLWLWENDRGQGRGSGSWKTLETRAWIEKLGVKKNFVSYQGLCRID
jgi:beta-lactamase superfamily II metal-dependent hydrolase